MIAINNLIFEIGARALYDEANWHIKPGEKIGLIGANGTGKTTLIEEAISDAIGIGKKVIVGALSHKAKRVLSEKLNHLSSVSPELSSWTKKVKRGI